MMTVERSVRYFDTWNYMDLGAVVTRYVYMLMNSKAISVNLYRVYLFYKRDKSRSSWDSYRFSISSHKQLSGIVNSVQQQKWRKEEKYGE